MPGAFARDVAALLAPHRALVAAVAFGLVIDVAFQTALPLSLKFLIDRAIVPGDRHLLTVLLLALAAGLALAAVAMIWRDWLYARLGAEVLRDIRGRLFAHLQSLSLDFFAATRAGDLLSRFSGDLASVELMVVGALPSVFGALLSLALLTIALFSLNLPLAIASVVLAPLCWIGPRLLLPQAAALGLEARRRDADALSLIQENLEGQAAVKALGLEAHGIARLKGRLDDAARAARRFNFSSYLAERLPNISMLGLHVAILVWGAFLAFDQRITVGTLVAFNAALLSLAAAVATLTSSAHTFLGASAGLRRIREILDRTPSVGDRPDAQPLPRLAGTLRLENVVFAHKESRVLDGVSLEIPPHASIAFVGPSGSGKSTALSLFARFIDPLEGRLTLDGVDVRGFTLASLRARIGIVQQDSFLFDGSVRDNIRLGRLDAKDGEVEDAAIAAEADGFIRHLPRGYETHLGAGGARLSGGQKQRIAIARALLRKPDLLLLDEATSALDPATERAVNATLAGLRGRHTSIRVTHRLAEAADCDRIFVLEAGRIAEQGAHAALLAQGGLYARLWRKQNGVSVTDNLEHAAITATWLSEWTLFEGADRVMLEEMSRAFVTERMPPGGVVMREGDPGDRFFIIVRGTVAVRRGEGKDDEEEVARLADGDAFGEMALLSDAPRNATVVAITDCVFLTLERASFRRWVDRDPRWRRQLETMAAAR